MAALLVALALATPVGPAADQPVLRRRSGQARRRAEADYVADTACASCHPAKYASRHVRAEDLIRRLDEIRRDERLDVSAAELLRSRS